MRASFRMFCLVAAVGCGGDDGVGIDTSQSNVCDEIAEVACHNLYNCCTEHEIQVFLRVSEPRTQVQCREDVKRSCERDIASLNFSIEQNRLRFDPNLMNNCLAAIVAPDATCAEVRRVPRLGVGRHGARRRRVPLRPRVRRCTGRVLRTESEVHRAARSRPGVRNRLRPGLLLREWHLPAAATRRWRVHVELAVRRRAVLRYRGDDAGVYRPAARRLHVYRRQRLPVQRVHPRRVRRSEPVELLPRYRLQRSLRRRRQLLLRSLELRERHVPDLRCVLLDSDGVRPRRRLHLPGRLRSR